MVGHRLERRGVKDNVGAIVFRDADQFFNRRQIVFKLGQQDIGGSNRRAALFHFFIGDRQVCARIDRNHVFGISAGDINQRVAGRAFAGGKQRDGVETGAVEVAAGEHAEIIAAHFADVMHPRTGAQRGDRLVCALAARAHHAVTGNQGLARFRETRHAGDDIEVERTKYAYLAFVHASLLKENVPAARAGCGGKTRCAAKHAPRQPVSSVTALK